MLALLGNIPDPAFPDVKSAKQQGYKIDLDLWRGIAVPKGTPKAVIAKLQDAIKKTVESPEFKEAGNKIGFTPAYQPADAFTKMIAEDDSALAAVIKEIKASEAVASRTVQAPKTPEPGMRPRSGLSCGRVAGSRWKHRAAIDSTLRREQGAWARPVSAARRRGDRRAWRCSPSPCSSLWHAALLAVRQGGPAGSRLLPLRARHRARPAGAGDPRRHPAQGRCAAATAVFLGHRDVLVVFAALVGVAFGFERADTYLVLGVFAAVLLLLVARTAPLACRPRRGAGHGCASGLFFRLGLGVRLPTGEFWYEIARPRCRASTGSSRRSPCPPSTI